MKQFCVYIMASKRNGTLYTGMSSGLITRTGQHKEKFFGAFTAKYNVCLLAYYKLHESAEEAIKREKRVKKMPRKEKLELIENFNPEWKDLYESLW